MSKSLAAGWCHAAALASLAWIAAWRPALAPAFAAAALVLHRPVDRSRAAEPWAGALVAVSVVAFLCIRGWEITVGWLLLAVMTAAVARALPRRDGGRPDAADYLAIGGWGVVFVLSPQLVSAQSGGWLAPGLLLYAAQRLARARVERSIESHRPLPPTREVRGTLSLGGLVVSDADSLPRSVPIDLELRAGDSIAILCDAPEEAAAFAGVLSGRRAPFAGEIMVDGSPLGRGDRLVAVVAPGEPFVTGDLVSNLGALADGPLDRAAVTALRETCSLNEVVEALGDRRVEADGSPLTPYQRILVLAARVIPSSYRLLVVVDPMPWVSAGRGERWRSALLRASVGRTAVWLTPDRELAACATHVMEYRQGSLRRVEHPEH